MADKTVKTHTNTPNREKPQGKKHQAALEKKVVFKSVLDNPYRIQWCVHLLLESPCTDLRQAKGP